MEDEILDAPQGASEPISTPEPQEQPSLRDTIAAAVAKQREPAKADVTEPEVKPEPKAEGDRSRDEKGRFAAKADDSEQPKAEAPKPEAKDAAPETGEAPKPDAQAALRPPTSWSPTAKVAFDKLPAEVQQAVAKREQEVNNGFAKLAEYKPLDQYVQMARESGTTLDQALNRYIAAERELQRDFVNGTVQLARQQGINPVQLAQAILARHGVSGQTDGGQQQGYQTPQVDLSPIQNELSALKSYIEEQQQAGVQSEISRFASDPKNVFFENVKADMGRLIDSGQAETLDDAYDKACWANKEIRALLIKQQQVATPSAKADDAVQRAKAADKATGGAPSAGFKEAPAVKPGASIRDTIRAAVNAQRGI
jgi:hypothetical protein